MARSLNYGCRQFIAGLAVLIMVVATTMLGGQNYRTYQKEGRYPQPQDFKVKEALFIKERNGAPFIIGSAFLIDKQRGLFASAKHVGVNARDRCKLFFNGKVYNAFLLRPATITDASIIKLDDKFDPADFPEPYTFAKIVRKGDKIYVRGIHTHGSKFQKDKKILPVLREYYGLLGASSEFVYDDLEGIVSDLNKIITNKDIGGTPKLLADISGTYIELKMKQDHGFSFAGLSGGPTVNERNELVGINSSEVSAYFELTKRGIEYHSWVTFHLVSAAELGKLIPRLAHIK